MRYGNRIEELLDQRGLKQSDMARKTKIHPVTISRWVNKIHLSTKELEIICKFFDISIAEFFQNDKEEAKKYDIPVEYLQLIKIVLSLEPNIREKIWSIIKEQISLLEDIKNN